MTASDAKSHTRGPHREIDLARAAAFARLARHASLFPDLEIGGPDERGLSAVDAAFAHAIVEGAVRHWLTLQHLVQGYLDGPFNALEPRLRGVLLGGAAQMTILERVPVHAAIDTAVDWAKRAIRPGAGGMVNAVLRRLSEQIDARSAAPWDGSRRAIPLGAGGTLGFRSEVLPEDEARRWSVATSTPMTLLQRWTARFEWREASRLALHGLADAPTIVNTCYATSELVPPGGLELLPHRDEGHWIARGPREALGALLRARRDVWVQDPASSRSLRGLCELLGPRSQPRLIVDLCAGQGTKTRQLLAEFPHARVLAADVDAARLGRLRELAGQEPRVRVLESREAMREAAGTADLVVLDVPCSNSGVLARRSEAKYRFETGQLGRLATLQREIIANSLRLLKDRATGWIVYATCSLEREEDEDQVRALVQAGFSVVREHRAWPQGLPGDDPASYRDGAYAGVLRRN